LRAQRSNPDIKDEELDCFVAFAPRNDEVFAKSNHHTMVRGQVLGITFLLTIIAATVLAPSVATFAQEWPARPVTMVVPFAAGGGQDIFGRLLAPRLSELLGRQVVVENIGGAGGLIAATRVAKAAPDGYQFLLGGSSTHLFSPILSKAPPYNPVSDFTPVALIIEQPMLLIARTDFPADTLPAFISYAKANQSRLQYGSAGLGASSHLACVLFNAAVGINVTHVPYRGSAPAMQDLIAGHNDYQCPTITTSAAQVQAGRVKGIAVLAKQRSAALPDLPSSDEQGLKDFDAGSWTALFFPKGTPAPIAERLHAAAVATMETPDVQGRLHAVGANVVAPGRRSADYLQAFVQREIDKWAPALKAAGVTLK
jgi:tripartite-type tricarboxylate transporter receptor subunit TctC